MEAIQSRDAITVYVKNANEDVEVLFQPGFVGIFHMLEIRVLSSQNDCL